MNKIKAITTALFALMLIYSCEESVREEIEGSLNIDSESEISQEEGKEEEEPKEQTVDERIVEIKSLYAEIQGAKDKEKNCTSNSVKDMNYDVIEDGIELTNKAKECRLNNDFMYQQVVMNGYEWSETCSFYYKEDKRFFAYLSGGAEGCGYDYRIYYDKDGEVIRVLLAENECDGQEVGNSKEITDEKRKGQIISSIANAEKEFKAILDK